MATWKFKTGICGVAVILGAPEAMAYPAGSVVSTGTNPVAAYGGEILGESTSTVTVVTASADQDFIITDVNIMPRFNDIGCRALVGVQLNLDTGGSPIAQYQLSWEVGVNTTFNTAPAYVDSHLTSGLRVPQGTSLSIDIDRHYLFGCGSGWGITYTLSGYHATP